MSGAVCVYCGSRDGADPRFGEAAEAVGRMLAGNGWGLVYGAGDVGLMGRVARAHQAAGGRALGVIPAHLFPREVAKGDLDRLVVTETMHERKKVMFMNADAVVCLPGGAGSLDEFFEALTWRQIGLHATDPAAERRGLLGPAAGPAGACGRAGVRGAGRAELRDRRAGCGGAGGGVAGGAVGRTARAEGPGALRG